MERHALDAVAHVVADLVGQAGSCPLGPAHGVKVEDEAVVEHGGQITAAHDEQVVIGVTVRHHLCFVDMIAL